MSIEIDTPQVTFPLSFYSLFSLRKCVTQKKIQEMQSMIDVFLHFSMMDTNGTNV